MSKIHKKTGSNKKIKQAEQILALKKKVLRKSRKRGKSIALSIHSIAQEFSKLDVEMNRLFSNQISSVLSKQKNKKSANLVNSNLENLLNKTAMDKVTKFKGIVTAYAVYSTGCAQIRLTPVVDSDGAVQDCCWIDVDRCEAMPRQSLRSKPLPNTGTPLGSEIAQTS